MYSPRLGALGALRNSRTISSIKFVARNARITKSLSRRSVKRVRVSTRSITRMKSMRYMLKRLRQKARWILSKHLILKLPG